jgi:SAM-dependent methyltransferase
MSSAKDLLSLVPAYIAWQKLVGADRLRYRCLDRVALEPGETVVDVGCGPAYYFDRLPQPLDYYGYDTAPRSIEWARKRWGDRASFHLGTFDREQAATLPPVDAVLLLGILHHLSDEESAELLTLLADVLAPGGRVVAVDTCVEPTQGRVSRWFSENDRGQHVRQPEGFTRLAEASFAVVEGETLNDVARIPGSFWMMTMSEPKRSAPLADAPSARDQSS